MKSSYFSKFIHYLILSSVFFLAGVYFVGFYDDIKTIYSYNEVADIWPKMDQNTLVIFDVDDTLVAAGDNCLRRPFSWERDLADYFKKYAAFPKDKKYKDFLESIAFNSSGSILIEPQIVNIIRELQKRNIKVIACTAIKPLGQYGVIRNMEEWRYQILKNFGIDFNSEKYHDVEFINLPKNNGRPPSFYKGILYSGSATKGQVVSALLDVTEWPISKIIFFDDHRFYLKSIGDAARRRGLIYEGYHYKGEKKLLPEKCNPEVAKIKFKNLMLNEKWLTDKEALEIYNFSNPESTANF